MSAENIKTFVTQASHPGLHSASVPGTYLFLSFLQIRSLGKIRYLSLRSRAGRRSRAPQVSGNVGLAVIPPSYNQVCGSGSVSGFNRVSGSGFGSRRAKITHKSRNFFKRSCFELLDGLF
jgi:hypothetical protein